MKYFRNKDRDDNTIGATPRVDSSQTDLNKLVEKAADGDYAAFGELYSLYLDRIFRYVFYQVKDRMRAEDITEEIFIKAWKAIASCKGKEPTFSAWLYRIAHNYLIDIFRSNKRLITVDIETISGNSNHNYGMEIELEQKYLMDMISDLPPSGFSFTGCS